MDPSSPLFTGYSMERICIDRVVVTIYDKRYAQEKHPFSSDVADHFPHRLKKSRIGKRSEDVISSSNGHASWEIRLRGPRTMVLHYNVIRAYKNQHDIKVPSDQIIKEDNVFPVDMVVPLENQIKLLYEAIDIAKGIYYNFVKDWWDYRCRDIEAVIKTVEIPYELYAANVPDLFEQVIVSGKNVYRYATQSNTLYFQEKDKEFDDYVNDSIYTINMTSNKFNTQFDKRVQFKIYQKLWGLARLEHTIYGDDIKHLFHQDIRKISEDADHIKLFLDSQFRQRGMYFSKHEASLSRVVELWSKSSGIPYDTLYNLAKIEIWESDRDNLAMTKRLKNRGFIFKDTTTLRGFYKISPEFKRMVEKFPERDDELPTLL